MTKPVSAEEIRRINDYRSNLLANASLKPPADTYTAHVGLLLRHIDYLEQRQALHDLELKQKDGSAQAWEAQARLEQHRAERALDEAAGLRELLGQLTAHVAERAQVLVLEVAVLAAVASGKVG